MFRVALRSCSTTFRSRRHCARRCATVSETIPDGPPVTATNRERVSLSMLVRKPHYTFSRCSINPKEILEDRQCPEKRRYNRDMALLASVNPDSSQPALDILFVTLDGRPLKTPSGQQLALPPSKRLLAALVANEWEIQETMIKPHALPLVSCFTVPYLCLSHTRSRHLWLPERSTDSATRILDNASSTIFSSTLIQTPSGERGPPSAYPTDAYSAITTPSPNPW